MQSLLFVFVGLDETATEVSLRQELPSLLLLLNRHTTLPHFELMKSKAGLMARLDDVSYYISIVNKKDHLQEWFQLAKDFELSGNRKPITQQELQKIYEKLAIVGKPYRSVHLLAAMEVFKEMNRSKRLSIYVFQ